MTINVNFPKISSNFSEHQKRHMKNPTLKKPTLSDKDPPRNILPT